MDAYLTGSQEFDELLRYDNCNPYVQWRATGNDGMLTQYLKEQALTLRDWFPGYIEEVRFTDRNHRFARLFSWPYMLDEAVLEHSFLDNKTLLSYPTDEPSDGLFLPVWLFAG
ncbi:MAG: hypothetical protein JSW47_05045 [Phycisphaerales bacterium]|nr:MAG: hypothetical protein JSW47_05045 [Phycisphaerales bacterium]